MKPPFAEVSALRQLAPGRFGAEVSAEWTISGKPNGGYLLSILGRGALSVSAHRDVIAASAHFVRTPDPGAVTIEAESLREGRSASQARVRMSQDDGICVEAIVTTGNLGEVTPAYWDGGLPSASTVAYDDCEPLKPPAAMMVNLLEQVEVRLEPASGGFTVGRPSGRGELRGWLALPGEAPFDTTSLLFAVDAFPPATFDVEFTGWVPTLELTVYIRAIPAPGPGSCAPAGATHCGASLRRNLLHMGFGGSPCGPKHATRGHPSGLSLPAMPESIGTSHI